MVVESRKRPRLPQPRRLRGRARSRASTCSGAPNGAGKTNLLEATYTALAGRSCRTRDDRETIAFGESLARGGGGRSPATASAAPFLSSVSRAEGRRHLVDGAPAGAEAAALRPALAVFMPDRLALVKGPPAGRRTHLDGFCAALWPARGEARRRYSRALAQRNALLGRIRAGVASTATPRRLGPRARRRRGRADRDPRRGGRAPGAAVRRAAERRSGSSREPRCATGRAARPTGATQLAAELGRAARGGHRARLHRLGPAPRRARARARRPLAAPLRLPGPAARPRCWRCCSPSAGRCSTTAARRR